MFRSQSRLRLSRAAWLCAVALPVALAVTPVAAKTLVFCSEGSPENFYPGINTTGTSFDAGEQIYKTNRSCTCWRNLGGFTILKVVIYLIRIVCDMFVHIWRIFPTGISFIFA